MSYLFNAYPHVGPVYCSTATIFNDDISDWNGEFWYFPACTTTTLITTTPFTRH